MLSTQIARAVDVEQQARVPRVPLHRVLGFRRTRLGQRRRAMVARLASLPQFSGFPAGDLAGVERHAERLVLPAGTVVEIEGTRSHQAVFLRSGRAMATSRGVEVGRVEAGDHVGVTSVLSGKPSTVTVTAVTEIEVVVLHATAIRAAVRDLPGLAGRLVDRLTFVPVPATAPVADAFDRAA